MSTEVSADQTALVSAGGFARYPLQGDHRQLAFPTKQPSRADAEALRERARALAGGEAGVLRIGAVPQFIETGLPVVLTTYAPTHPENMPRIAIVG